MSAVVTDETVETDEDREAIESMNENGRSIEDRADAGEHEDEDEEDGQFLIPGTGTGLSLTVGGKKPSVSEARLDSLTLAIKGEFKKGDRIRLMVDCVVRDVNFPDDYKGVEIQRTRRVHKFRPVAVEPMDAPD